MKMTKEQFYALARCLNSAACQEYEILTERINKLEKLLVESEEDLPTAKDNDGWIEHDGKGLTLVKGTLVEVERRNGEKTIGEVGDYKQDLEFAFWRYTAHKLDIKRYRIVKQEDNNEIKSDAIYKNLKTYNPDTHYLVPREITADDIVNLNNKNNMIHWNYFLKAIEKVFGNKGE